MHDRCLAKKPWEHGRVDTVGRKHVVRFSLPSTHRPSADTASIILRNLMAPIEISQVAWRLYLQMILMPCAVAACMMELAIAAKSLSRKHLTSQLSWNSLEKLYLKGFFPDQHNAMRFFVIFFLFEIFTRLSLYPPRRVYFSAVHFFFFRQTYIGVLLQTCRCAPMRSGV